MNHECKQERVFDIIFNELKTINKKLDMLLRSKYILSGMSAAIGAIAALIFNLL